MYLDRYTIDKAISIVHPSTVILWLFFLLKTRGCENRLVNFALKQSYSLETPFRCFGIRIRIIKRIESYLHFFKVIIQT